MALSHSYVRGLQDAVNDNLDLLPSELRRAPTPVDPLRRPKLEVEMPTLATTLEADSGILWARMKHQDRGCYTPALVGDSRSFQLYLKEQCCHLSPAEMPFKYLVWTSAAKGVFSLGGDLAFFGKCVRTGDERRLTEYAHRCIDVLHDNYNAMGLPVLTVALVTGDAIGGGLESMITNDIVVAEKGVKFGLPEILFNLFPGMGGYSYLVRKIGEKNARAFVEDGRSRSAEEMLELGLVDVLAEPGQGEQASARVPPTRPAASPPAHHPPRLQAGRSRTEAGALRYRRHLGRARHADQWRRPPPHGLPRQGPGKEAREGLNARPLRPHRRNVSSHRQSPLPLVNGYKSCRQSPSPPGPTVPRHSPLAMRSTA